MTGQNFSQSQKQSQSQVFAPQLRHSLKILQASTLDLRNTISEELQSNPTLEELPFEGSLSLDSEEQSSSNDSSNDDSSQEIEFADDFQVLNKLDEEWRDHFDQERQLNPYNPDLAHKHQFFLDSVTSEQSIQEHLLEQAHLAEISQDQFDAIEFIVGSLDDKGFLSTPLKELAESSKIPLDTLQIAKDTLKSFDPTGIGSETIQECLLAQLPPQNTVAADILTNHYDLLIRRRIPDIARKMNLHAEDIQDAIEEISQLDPAPGRQFQEDFNRTVLPDVTISKDENNQFHVSLNNEYIPRLRISRAYKDLISAGNLGSKEKEYIRDKIRSGKFIISAIEQRQDTIRRISDTILKVQHDFFLHGVSKLHPLTMAQVGTMLELHETTISRATANKYILTPHGLFPFKYFFTSGYQNDEGESVSNTSVKEEIASIINSEPSSKPFSDQKIADILQENGTKIARRTVAKYREELGILATSLRRKY